jgi:hypothetical protein
VSAEEQAEALKGADPGSLDGGVLKQENELLVNSLGPCLFSQATTTDEGVTIPHLVALMAYCLMGSGNMREVLNE